MKKETLEEIALLKELIDNPDTPQEEKELYRETIKELEKEAATEEKPKAPAKTAPKSKTTAPKVEKPKAPAKPKKLPVDADKMKAEIRERTGKTEEECEQIIAEYRKTREKSNKNRKQRLEELKEEGKVISGTSEKTAGAVIEDAATKIKEKIEKQVDQIEKEADKGNRTPEQIEARITRNLDKLSKEMTQQATTFIKGIQAELAKADKTEAKQFLLNVREEIDELLNKFAGGGGVESPSKKEMLDYLNMYFDYYSELRTIAIEEDNILTRKMLKSLDDEQLEMAYEDAKYEIKLDTQYAKGGGVGSKRSHSAKLMSDLKRLWKNQDKGDRREFLGWAGYSNEESRDLSFEDWDDLEDDVQYQLYETYYGIFAKGGWLRDRNHVNESEDYEVRYDKNHPSSRSGYQKKKFSGGGNVEPITERQKDELVDYVYRSYGKEGSHKKDVNGGFTRTQIARAVDKYVKQKPEMWGGGDTVDKMMVMEILVPGFNNLDEFDRGGSVDSDISRYKKQLIQKAKNKGLYENFGQDEVRKLEDKYGYTPEVESFDNWAMNFDLEQLKRYDSGGMVQTYNITQNMGASSVNPSQFGEGGDISPFKGERFSQEEFDYRLNLAKSQIISDIMDGTVNPRKVNDFGDLGAFVDHNYYGGFIEDDYDHSKGFVFEMKVQDALDNWIKEGGINKALENTELFAVGGSVEDEISYNNSRIYNLKELLDMSNEEEKANIQRQIDKIELENEKLKNGDTAPKAKKGFFGLF